MKLGDVILLGLTIVGAYVVGKKILTSIRRNVPSDKGEVKTNLSDAEVQVKAPQVVVLQPGISLNADDFNVVTWVEG